MLILGLIISLLSVGFPDLHTIAQIPNSSVVDHWDHNCSSWAPLLRRLLKDDEITDFQSLLGDFKISGEKQPGKWFLVS